MKPNVPPLESEEEDASVLLGKLNARQQNRQTATEVAATTLGASVEGSEGLEVDVSKSTSIASLDYVSAAKALWRLGWITWWVQLILTVISAVILLFAFAFPGVNVRSSASAVGFILSGAGIVVAFFSLFWTYSYTRLSLWLKGDANRMVERAQQRIVGKLRVGLVLALLGLVISLTGLQAIVGTLLARLLSAGIATVPYSSYQNAGAGNFAPGAGLVQPVDVLVVQANANAMMAFVTALVTTVWLRGRAKKWQQTKAS